MGTIEPGSNRCVVPSTISLPRISTSQFPTSPSPAPPTTSTPPASHRIAPPVLVLWGAGSSPQLRKGVIVRSSLSQCFASDDRVHFTTPHRLPLNPKSRFFAPLLALGRQVWGLVKKLGIPLHLVAPKESHPCLLPQFLLPGPLHHNAAFRTEPQMKRKTWKPLRFGPCLDGIVKPSNPEPSKPGECNLCLTPGKNPFPGLSAGD